MIPRGFGDNEKVFGSTFAEGEFTSRDGLKFITGSLLYFDEQNLFLHGDGWVLEYRPL